MAVITFTALVRGEVRIVTRPAVVEETEGGYQVDGKFIAERWVHEIRRVKTMRKHCFRCWKNCNWFSGGVHVCDEHSLVEDRVALEGDDLWIEGMHDDD